MTSLKRCDSNWCQECRRLGQVSCSDCDCLKDLIQQKELSDEKILSDHQFLCWYYKISQQRLIFDFKVKELQEFTN